MQSQRKCAISVALAMSLCIATPDALASLPSDKSVSYSLHTDPEDETSPVHFIIRLDVAAIDSNGTALGWEIATAHFTSVNTSGTADAEWTADWPDVDTPDGLWWVSHADSKDPQIAEFNAIPLLAGTATADKSSDPDLNYDFQSAPCDGSCDQMYSGSVSALDYALWTGFSQSGTQVDEDDDDEPAEVGPGENDPPVG